MPINQTIIAGALAALLSVPSFADYHSAIDGSTKSIHYGSMSHDYFGTTSEVAPTVWSAPTNEREARLQVLRDLLAYSGLSAEELRKAAMLSFSYFTEHMLEPPASVRLIANQDPEDGRGYLRMEIPVSVGSSDELADLDFEISMKVATALKSGTEKLIVSVVRA